MIDIEKVKDKVINISNDLGGLNIDSIFIEQNNVVDKIIYKDEELHELRSCSKLLVAMAIGIAIDKNMLTLNTKVYPIIKDKVKIKETNLEKVKQWDIKTLLTHTTGYKKMIMTAKEIKEKNLDVNNILSYVLNVDIPNEVGINYVYNNVEPFILSVFFQEKFGINLCKFINKNIFSKLNINDFKWNNYGKYCPGCTGLFLKHRDFHKIGKVLLNNGVYDDCQIISKKWVKEMCSLQIETPMLFKAKQVLPKIGAGYYTFISRDGYIFRSGSNGQYIIINKDKNLLISIMSAEKEMNNITEIFREVI